LSPGTLGALGRRTSSVPTAIIAALSTAIPASWASTLPLTGTAEAVVSAGNTELAPAGGGDTVAGDGKTVGNRLDGSTAGETLRPGMGGNVGDSVAGSTEVGLVDPAPGVIATTSVAVHEYPRAPVAETCVVSSTSSPARAPACTCTVASSASAWPTLRAPTEQVVPLLCGQMLKVGVPTLEPGAT